MSADGSYEWDSTKDAANRRKHRGVSFAEAAQALEYRGRPTFDDGSGTGRVMGIGYSSEARMLTVIFEAGDGGRDRSISARRSSQAERRLFMSNATKGE